MVLGMEVDAVFRRHAVAVELDSHRFHRTRTAFEEDRRRSAILTARGWRTVRFTASHVDDDGGRFAVDILRELLGVRPTVRS